ncbi:MAG: bifunctional folylpolyglutamate synthase/dihydrofolate synthase [Fimbriiglobus sp.]
MTYDEAIAFWYGRINFEVRAAGPDDLKLERMRALARLVGDPHDRLRIVHITGTKGKGSTAAMLAAVLRASGYRVGLFTSPHLTRVEERTQVDGVPITPAELAAGMARIADAARELDAAPFHGPTFFEIGTALGFLHFVLRRVDVAVVEVGLGGRFDSTNICRPLVAVLTCVGLDHTAILGNTLEEIAFQKAGIFKPGVPAVSGVVEPGPAAVVDRIAAQTRCPLFRVGRDFSARYEPGDPPRAEVVTSRRHYPPLPLGLLGPHQAANAAVAVQTVERLRGAGLHLPDAALAAGLAGVKWPARVELVGRRPWVVLDTAHNVPSVDALVNTLRDVVPAGGRSRVVFAASADKPFAEMLAGLAGYFDEFHLTRFGTNPRGVPPEKLAETLRIVAPNSPAVVHANAATAWDAVARMTGRDDLACVTGSVFLAGELEAAVRTTAAQQIA